MLKQNKDKAPQVETRELQKSRFSVNQSGIIPRHHTSNDKLNAQSTSIINGTSANTFSRVSRFTGFAICVLNPASLDRSRSSG